MYKSGCNKEYIFVYFFLGYWEYKKRELFELFDLDTKQKSDWKKENAKIDNCGSDVLSACVGQWPDQ